MEKFRFLNWQVYKDSKVLFSIVLEITKELPKEFKFTISSQLTRAAFSVILNIAEGSGKESDKELKRYFDIAQGSCYEVLAAADTLKDQDLIRQDTYINLYNKIEEVSKQLGGFKKYIEKL